MITNVRGNSSKEVTRIFLSKPPTGIWKTLTTIQNVKELRTKQCPQPTKDVQEKIIT